MKTNIRQRTGIPLRAFAMLLGVLLITGCAGGSHVGESWQCPIAQGVACQSVSEADPAVGSAGEDLKTSVPSPGRSIETTGTPFLSGILAWFAELFSGEEVEEVATAEPLFVLPEVKTPDPANEALRTKERIARIWIAPYVDAQNNYHEGYWVRAVIKPASWRLP